MNQAALWKIMESYNILNDLAFSADGQMVMYICNDTTIRLWDTGFRFRV